MVTKALSPDEPRQNLPRQHRITTRVVSAITESGEVNQCHRSCHQRCSNCNGNIGDELRQMASRSGFNITIILHCSHLCHYNVTFVVFAGAYVIIEDGLIEKRLPFVSLSGARWAEGRLLTAVSRMPAADSTIWAALPMKIAEPESACRSLAADLQAGAKYGHPESIFTVRSPYLRHTRRNQYCQNLSRRRRQFSCRGNA